MSKIIMTTAQIMKKLNMLEEKKELLRNQESENHEYTVAQGEEACIPNYDFTEVNNAIEKLDEQIANLKHIINVENVKNTLNINGEEVTIDRALVRMSQLQRRKTVMNTMRLKQPKRRIQSYSFNSNRGVPEYEVLNYDLELAKKEFERVDSIIATIQLELDNYNHTHKITVEE